MLGRREAVAACMQTGGTIVGILLDAEGWWGVNFHAFVAWLSLVSVDSLHGREASKTTREQ